MIKEQNLEFPTYENYFKNKITARAANFCNPWLTRARINQKYDKTDYEIL
jgi:hypothetical protein